MYTYIYTHTYIPTARENKPFKKKSRDILNIDRDHFYCITSGETVVVLRIRNIVLTIVRWAQHNIKNITRKAWLPKITKLFLRNNAISNKIRPYSC